jgi:hypothetical protein
LIQPINPCEEKEEEDEEEDEVDPIPVLDPKKRRKRLVLNFGRNCSQFASGYKTFDRRLESI